MWMATFSQNQSMVAWNIGILLLKRYKTTFYALTSWNRNVTADLFWICRVSDRSGSKLVKTFPDLMSGNSIIFLAYTSWRGIIDGDSFAAWTSPSFALDLAVDLSMYSTFILASKLPNCSTVDLPRPFAAVFSRVIAGKLCPHVMQVKVPKNQSVLKLVYLDLWYVRVKTHLFGAMTILMMRRSRNGQMDRKRIESKE